MCGETERWRDGGYGRRGRYLVVHVPGWFALLNQRKHNGGLIIIGALRVCTNRLWAY